MSRPRFTKRKNPYLAWAPALGIGVVLFPWSIHHVDFRSTFANGISVAAHKASPAYAAFEDLREDYLPTSPAPPVHTILLSAGQKYSLPVELRAGFVRQVALKGMTIHLPASEIVKPVQIAAAPVALPRPAKMLSLSAVAPVVLAEETRAVREPALPIADRQREMLAELEKQDWSRPTAGALALELVKRELDRHQDPAAPPPASANLGSTLATHNFNAAELRPLWLTGQVEMTGGLAFVGPETQIVIKRMFNGRTFEQGRIWVTEGKFEIRVKAPTGFLVAELQTRDQRVLGRGELNLLSLGQLPKDDKVGDLRIALRPTAEGVTLAALSGDSYDRHRLPVADARIEIQAYTDPQKVNAEGQVTEPTLSRDSSFVARALAPSHWSSLAVGQARDAQDIRLYKNSLVEALIGLNAVATDKKEALRQGVVWGRLLQKGETVANAQVEMAGGYLPIYFNERYLPDPHLTGTTKNGLFAFIRVRPGVQALRVRVAGKVFPAQVFPTAEKHVSFLELDVRDKVISQFKVFDGQDLTKPVAARIRLVGTDETLAVGKDDFVEYSLAANPFMIEADGGAEYEVSRVAVTGTPHVVNIPLVEREWLYQLALDHHIQPQAKRGIVVGYMDTQDFEVELTGYAPGESMQVVYFDSHGKAIEGKTGVAGGGFVIFAAPPGLQTLYVHPTQSREAFSQIVVAEPEFVQVVTH